MAVVQHQTADQTVNTIADRNNPNIIKFKRDGMIVTVNDAIADPDAGPGVATYLWNKTLNKWLLMSKSTTETMSFQTAELTIGDGKVALPNIPNNNVLWDIYVIDANGIIVAELRLENIIVSPTLISGLGDYNGKKLRFTYAFGSITQQMSTFIEDKILGVNNNIESAISVAKEDFTIQLSTISENITNINENITNVSNTVMDEIGTIADFEGALNG